MTDLLAPAEQLEPSGPATRRKSTGAVRYVLGKLGGALLSVLFVVALGFLLFRVIPGDPVVTMTRGRPVGAEQIAALRAEFGLDQPLWVQFFRYFGDVLQGDLGTSYTYSRPVADLILERLWPTVLLVGTGTVLAVCIGLFLGIRSAWRHNSRFDKLATGSALTLWSVPTFWLGMVLLMATGKLFPSGGLTDPSTPPGFFPQLLDIAHHLVLPCLTFTAVVFAQYQLVMRSALLEEMGADYLNTARAKGLTDDQVRGRHAVPNAMLPTTTLIFLRLGLVVQGAITVETVFSWPGLGWLLYEGLSAPDFPVLQGVFLVLAASVVVMNVFADLVYRVLDPRVRAA
ncbi:peptide/nickel transport system permease protein [Crossiella equi]|uniref:Peptide/nickel transport system permease protein n=1 Tax=Crossiella equi TaxID=130796 RepID=A0ABS5A4H8_9PSEU|nr:ABC transporter permease [Crossiella equi]MBP2471480.1 peptide/nickel transport system permease protein [Crossiella equi]